MRSRATIASADGTQDTKVIFFSFRYSTSCTGKENSRVGMISSVAPAASIRYRSLAEASAENGDWLPMTSSAVKPNSLT